MAEQMFTLPGVGLLLGEMPWPKRDGSADMVLLLDGLPPSHVQIYCGLRVLSNEQVKLSNSQPVFATEHPLPCERP